ncbi:hypothetical protein KAM329D_11890 [Aeromonas caviae]|nr:hypothetical protein C6B42_15145 [Aeromonas caviae]BCM76941.1 hypothetical protein KAM329_034880 [Aeromonas caviae]GJA49874.1 hypothetical protein KAM347_16650 [Aeromonas caviae]GJA58269.1 hypothetical protein KAM350_12620 [Aeromonas caviae]GJA66772.1 hypothetical protein KAM352_07480 [Aeromonas caviae]
MAHAIPPVFFGSPTTDPTLCGLRIEEVREATIIGGLVHERVVGTAGHRHRQGAGNLGARRER